MCAIGACFVNRWSAGRNRIRHRQTAPSQGGGRSRGMGASMTHAISANTKKIGLDTPPLPKVARNGSTRSLFSSSVAGNNGCLDVAAAVQHVAQNLLQA